MSILYKYRAYSKALKGFTEQFEYKSPEALLALLQWRFDALTDVERENAAQDFKTLTDNINIIWSGENLPDTVDSHIQPYTFHSNDHIYFVDIVSL